MGTAPADPGHKKGELLPICQVGINKQYIQNRLINFVYVDLQASNILKYIYRKELTSMDDIISAIEEEMEYIKYMLQDCTLPTKNYYEGKLSAYDTVLVLLSEERRNNMDG